MNSLGHSRVVGPALKPQVFVTPQQERFDGVDGQFNAVEPRAAGEVVGAQHSVPGLAETNRVLEPKVRITRRNPRQVQPRKQGRGWRDDGVDVFPEYTAGGRLGAGPPELR